MEELNPDLKYIVDNISDLVPEDRSIERDVAQALTADADSVFSSFANTETILRSTLGVDLYANQVEVVKAIIDPAIPYIVVVSARGSGKTFAVGCALLVLGLLFPMLPIGIFGPKIDQSARIISEIRRVLAAAGKAGEVFEAENLESVSAYKIVFKNGSYIQAMSASEQSEIEGFHGIVILDECFPKDVKVVTDRGKLAIKDIVDGRIACKALSKNPNTGNLEYRDIVDYFKVPYKKDLIKINYQMPDGTTKSLICSDNHKVYTKNRGYVEAKDLLPQDVLIYMEDKIVEP